MLFKMVAGNMNVESEFINMINNFCRIMRYDGENGDGSMSGRKNEDTENFKIDQNAISSLVASSCAANSDEEFLAFLFAIYSEFKRRKSLNSLNSAENVENLNQNGNSVSSEIPVVAAATENLRIANSCNSEPILINEVPIGSESDSKTCNEKKSQIPVTIKKVPMITGSKEPVVTGNSQKQRSYADNVRSVKAKGKFNNFNIVVTGNSGKRVVSGPGEDRGNVPLIRIHDLDRLKDLPMNAGTVIDAPEEMITFLLTGYNEFRGLAAIADDAKRNQLMSDRLRELFQRNALPDAFVRRGARFDAGKLVISTGFIDFNDSNFVNVDKLGPGNNNYYSVNNNYYEIINNNYYSDGLFDYHFIKDDKIMAHLLKKWYRLNGAILSGDETKISLELDHLKKIGRVSNSLHWDGKKLVYRLKSVRRARVTPGDIKWDIRGSLIEEIVDDDFVKYDQLEDPSERALNLVYLLNNRPGLMWKVKESKKIKKGKVDGEEILARNVAFLGLGKKFDSDNTSVILSHLSQDDKGPVGLAAKKMEKKREDQKVMDRVEKQIAKIRISTIDVFNDFVKYILKKHKNTGFDDVVVDLCEKADEKHKSVKENERDIWQLVLDYLRDILLSKRRNSKLTVSFREQAWRSEKRVKEFRQIIEEMKKWIGKPVSEEIEVTKEAMEKKVTEVSKEEKEKNVIDLTEGEENVKNVTDDKIEVENSVKVSEDKKEEISEKLAGVRKEEIVKKLTNVSVEIVKEVSEEKKNVTPKKSIEPAPVIVDSKKVNKEEKEKSPTSKPVSKATSPKSTPIANGTRNKKLEKKLSATGNKGDKK